MYEPGTLTGAYLSVGELAQRLGCSRSSIYRSVRRGRLRGLRLAPGGDIRIPTTELQRLMLIDGSAEERLQGGREL